mmetsp:Transcript_25909/g.61003  ORF Transcript_25909/g.61003 Transcript_25909/m.61003 type:complete len:192 (+) Transcript_25909:145-720(+)
MAAESEEPLLDAKNMDGPAVKWTIADLFAVNNNLFMTYHVMGAGWDALTPVGSVLGGVLFGTNLYRPYPGLLASMGTVGFGVGCAGMALGLAKMSHTASQGENASPPWNKDGVQNRVDGLKHNFMVRVMDLSAWSGMGLAAAAMVGFGGPANLGLAKGSIGVVQGLALGSTLGGFGAFGCISQFCKPSKGD